MIPAEKKTMGCWTEDVQGGLAVKTMVVWCGFVLAVVSNRDQKLVETV